MTTAAIGTATTGFAMTFSSVLVNGDATAWAERRREAREWLLVTAAEAFLVAACEA